MGRVFFFLTFLITLFGLLLGHDIAAIAKIKSANQELKQELDQPSAFDFQKRNSILLASASQTWIPGFDKLALGRSEAEILVSISCQKTTNPFAYLVGHGDVINFSDLDDANGNSFICEEDRP